MRRVLALLAGLVALAGCTTSDELGGSVTETTAVPTTSAVPAPPVVDCGDPVASFAPSGPLPPPDNLPASLDPITADGRLTVGVSADTLLFGARNPFTGVIEGFDIDILHEVARALFGDPDAIEFRIITYADRLPSLEAGTVEIVAHTMTINCAVGSASTSPASTSAPARRCWCAPTALRRVSTTSMANGCAPLPVRPTSTTWPLIRA